MTEAWAISGPDLHLELAGHRGRAALIRAIREAVESTRLQPGTRLPSSRTLALDLGLARNTVANAYSQLVAEGWLLAQQGSGTRVAARPVTGSVREAAPARRGTTFRYDLRAGQPDLTMFPRTAWLTAARRAVSQAPATAFGYDDPRGHIELRRALADYLGRARGVRASADQIVVCSGFTQALGLVCRALVATGGGDLAAETYGHRLHHDVVASTGVRVRTIGVDEDGANVDQLKDAGAALLTPAHQFPLGVPLVAHRRTRVVQWAASTGGYVIEDDYDGEFRYDRHAAGALQGLAPDHVVYAGTASKTLAPGLRLAWLVVPDRLLDAVITAKRLADRQTGALDQLTLDEFLRSGQYDRHVRRCRLAYRRRRDRLVAALARRAPEVRLTGIAAGLQAVLELPPGADADDVVTRAAARGLALESFDVYRTGSDDPGPALVIGYGTPPAHAYSTALTRLCSVVRESLAAR